MRDTHTYRTSHTHTHLFIVISCLVTEHRIVNISCQNGKPAKPSKQHLIDHSKSPNDPQPWTASASASHCHAPLRLVLCRAQRLTLVAFVVVRWVGWLVCSVASAVEFLVGYVGIYIIIIRSAFDICKHDCATLHTTHTQSQNN